MPKIQEKLKETQFNTATILQKLSENERDTLYKHVLDSIDPEILKAVMKAPSHSMYDAARIIGIPSGPTGPVWRPRCPTSGMAMENAHQNMGIKR